MQRIGGIIDIAASSRKVKARYASNPSAIPSSSCRAHCATWRGTADCNAMPGFLLVFDLDGTLVDSVPDLCAALNQTLRERGRRLLSPPQVKHMVGPGVPETLTALRDRGYRAAICTNKPQRATIAVLQGVGLLPFFDGIGGGDRFAVRKPDPGHLLGVISELGASPE